MWVLLLYIALAGAAGGLTNALLADAGLHMPQIETVDDGITVYRPGWIGHVLIGAVAAAVSWGLYGQFAAYYIAGSSEAMSANVPPRQSRADPILLYGGGACGNRWCPMAHERSG